MYVLDSYMDDFWGNGFLGGLLWFLVTGYDHGAPDGVKLECLGMLGH